jgi:hypothetical protein
MAIPVHRGARGRSQGPSTGTRHFRWGGPPGPRATPSSAPLDGVIGLLWREEPAGGPAGPEGTPQGVRPTKSVNCLYSCFVDATLVHRRSAAGMSRSLHHKEQREHQQEH